MEDETRQQVLAEQAQRAQPAEAKRQAEADATEADSASESRVQANPEPDAGPVRNGEDRVVAGAEERFVHSPPCSGKLKVDVIGCRHVLPADDSGKSDVYVTLQLGEHKKLQTHVQSKTLDPHFEESFELSLEAEERSNPTSVDKCLLVKVWDRDRGSRDDFLGQVSLSLGEALGAGWLDTEVHRSYALTDPACRIVHGKGIEGKEIAKRKANGDESPYGSVELRLSFRPEDMNAAAAHLLAQKHLSKKRLSSSSTSASADSKQPVVDTAQSCDPEPEPEREPDDTRDQTEHAPKVVLDAKPRSTLESEAVFVASMQDAKKVGADLVPAACKLDGSADEPEVESHAERSDASVDSMAMARDLAGGADKSESSKSEPEPQLQPEPEPEPEPEAASVSADSTGQVERNNDGIGLWGVAAKPEDSARKSEARVKMELQPETARSGEDDDAVIPQPEMADALATSSQPSGIPLEFDDEKAALAKADKDEEAEAQAWSVRVEAAIAAKGAASSTGEGSALDLEVAPQAELAPEMRPQSERQLTVQPELQLETARNGEDDDVVIPQPLTSSQPSGSPEDVTPLSHTDESPWWTRACRCVTLSPEDASPAPRGAQPLQEPGAGASVIKREDPMQTARHVTGDPASVGHLIQHLPVGIEARGEPEPEPHYPPQQQQQQQEEEEEEEVRCVLSLLKASKAGNTKEVTQLLRDGASVFADGALIWAAGGNHVDTMEVLVEAGADIDTKNQSGYTPLMRAAGQGSLDAVKWLLDRGVDWRTTEPRGRTARDIAANHAQGEVAKTLQLWDTTMNCSSEVAQAEIHRRVSEAEPTAEAAVVNAADAMAVGMASADPAADSVQNAQPTALLKVPSADWLLEKQQEEEAEVATTPPTVRPASSSSSSCTAASVLQRQRADEEELEIGEEQDPVDLEVLYGDLLAGYNPGS